MLVCYIDTSIVPVMFIARLSYQEVEGTVGGAEIGDKASKPLTTVHDLVSNIC